MSDGLYTRIQLALPRLREWIEHFIDAHKTDSVLLSGLAEAPLLRVFPLDLLASTHVVALPQVRFPPVGQFGLPEFAAMAALPLAGITFDDTFFVQAGAQTQSLYFHETVHVVQWQHLGFDRFLLAYAANMVGRQYADNPLETMAYSLQREFETGALQGDPVTRIQVAADAAWSHVSGRFEL